MPESTPNLYRSLPQLSSLLEGEALQQLAAQFSRALVAECARAALGQLRAQLKEQQHTAASLQAAVHALPEQIAARLRSLARPSLRRLLNATGVILQTNLGRAPLSAAAVGHLAEIASGYCNLEYDLSAGERSRRDVHAEDLLLHVLALRSGRALDALEATHAAAVVNNCAAATFLGLNTLAEGGEVLVSRGELVEIGGGFRVPEILRKSGATLREVGTTNRTRARDYAEAITPQTRLILRVHRSNFRMEGFTEQPTLRDLIAVGRQHHLPVFEDQGTGALVSLEELGLQGESSFLQSAFSGLTLVAASGDKLLGGPQCGLLVGERATLDRVRTNPLFRALRVDKLTYAALESTLLAYLTGHEDELPILRALHTPAEAIRARCEGLAQALQSHGQAAEVIAVHSVIGGGTTPGSSLPSYAVALRPTAMTEAAYAAHLRGLDPPIIARIQEGAVHLDLRTVAPGEDALLAHLLTHEHPAAMPAHTPDAGA